MSTRRKFTKYLVILALIAMTTLIWGCKADIDSGDAVAVTSITVTGTDNASSVNEGSSLQMKAEVLPANASDKSVTWMVADGTGKATISKTGLLVGTAEGLVTVKAKANDGSGVGGTKKITVNFRPFVASLFPEHEKIGVATTTSIEASFNKAMDTSTIIPENFTVIKTVGGTIIEGVVTYNPLTKTATFNPDSDLEYNTKYTATVTTDVKDLAGLALLEEKEWTFTTAETIELEGVGPALINLRSASNFAILAKSAITTTGGTLITGDIGVSPAALTDLTGFSETLAGDGTSATSIYVEGKIYASNMQEPAPSTLTTAISDVEAAYVEAAGRGAADYEVKNDLYGGTIDGQIFAPGIYKWSTVVTMDTDITLKGGPNDTWIFQIAGNFTVGSGAKVKLINGAQAKNIFWQVSEIVTLNPGAHLEGIILGMTQIKLLTGASVHGKLFAQKQVTLDTAKVTPL